MRFSLRWLFGLVAFVAIGCVSLINASNAISHALSVALFAFLVASILAAIFACRVHRPFWTGCAVAGWCYIATACLPPRIQMPWIATSAMLEQLHQQVVRETVIAARSYSYSVESPPSEPFYAIGHVLAVFVWAFAGGIAAACFRRDESKG